MTSFIRRPPVPAFNATQNSNLGGINNASPVLLSEELLAERSNIFTEFLDSQRCSSDGLEYKEKIRGLLRRGESRLLVSLNDIRKFNEPFQQGILLQPLEYLNACDKSLRAIIDTLYEPELPYPDMSKVYFHVGIESGGGFGENQLNTRELSSRYLSKLISIDGIVTSCFLVRPKLSRSVHYIEAKKIFLTREYRDATTNFGNNYIPTSNTYPTDDGEGNKLSTDYGYCLYRDSQKIVIQEMPERAPPGQLPRSVEVLLADDLVDKVKPGDRVQLVGVYKALASITNSQVPSHFRTVILANSIRLLGKESQQPLLTDLDIQNIKKISKREDIFDLLGRSLAPSIFGHEYIKKAALLMLLGGVEKNLENTHIRGDINMLLVGDPSTAKSQILRFVLNIAPLAIATTGRGSSGVGLTAAVTLDKETGERRLEAGAMVLADRGIVCIDEFDKMSELDRVAIHEVMEQQTVTIAKAGIHLSLNARCSVIAAANPIYSQYRESLSPQENIRLPDSLLSRFDLLFIVLDHMNERNDRFISKHVTAMHRYLPSGLEEGAVMQDKLSHFAQTEEDDDRERLETPIFQKFYYHLSDADEAHGESKDVLSIAFIKKYIHYAKVRIKPTLTLNASEAIKRSYNEFRAKKQESSNEEKTLPVTPRTLETLIRLATAHAKTRLSMVVEEQDAATAEELLRFCLYKEVLPKRVPPKKKRTEAKAKDDEDDPSLDAALTKKLSINDKKTTGGRVVDDDASDNNEDEADVPGEQANLDDFEFTEKSPASKVKPKDRPRISLSSTMTEETAMKSSSSLSEPPVHLTSELIVKVKTGLLKIREKHPNDSMFSVSSILLEMNSTLEEHEKLSLGEVEAVLKQMQDANLVMYRDGFVIFL